MKLDVRAILMALLVAITWPSHAQHANQGTANEDLLRAIVRGTSGEVRIALDRGADPDARDPKGRSALLIAVLLDQPDALRLLLEAGATTVNEPQDNGRDIVTPLAFAAWKGRADVVTLLLEKGADFKLNGQDAWRGAVVSGASPVVESILKAGASPNYRFADGASPLAIASLRGYTNVVALLLDHEGDVNFRDNEGTTLLMFAAARGYEPTVRLLLERGATTWPLNAFNDNALKAASQNQNAESRAQIEALLRSHGAKMPPKNRDIDNQLLLAAHAGDLAQVKALLANGADLEARGEVNIKLWLRDALSAAVAHGPVCRFLLERGINAHRIDSGGFTAMHSAAAEGDADCIKALAAAGLDPNARSRAGHSPLFMAINSGRPNGIIETLLSVGADANGTSLSGSEPLTAFARRRGFERIAKLLVAAGGKE